MTLVDELWWARLPGAMLALISAGLGDHAEMLARGKTWHCPVSQASGPGLPPGRRLTLEIACGGAGDYRRTTILDC